MNKQAQIAELEVDLEAARHDLRHGSIETWKRAARRAITLLEAELAELNQKI